MALSQDNAAWFADTFTRIVDNVGQALLGKEDVVRHPLVQAIVQAYETFDAQNPPPP